jgi:hypothetical protein
MAIGASELIFMISSMRQSARTMTYLVTQKRFWVKPSLTAVDAVHCAHVAEKRFSAMRRSVFFTGLRPVFVRYKPR